MKVNLENLYRDIGAKGLISGEDNPVFQRNRYDEGHPDTALGNPYVPAGQ